MIALRKGRGSLVLNHHGIGNVVMSSPFLEALSRAVKGTSPVHVLLANSQRYELLRENGLPILPIYLDKHKGLTGFFRLIRRYRGSIDLVVGVPQVPLRLVIVFKLLLGARYAAAEVSSQPSRFLLSHAVEKHPTKSILESQKELLRVLGISVEPSVPRIQLTSEEQAWSKHLLLSRGVGDHHIVLGVHSSSEKANKRWPTDRFAEVVASLSRNLPLAVVSFGSQGERAAATRVREAAGEVLWIEGTGEWSIRQSAAIVARCRLLICGDTGLMHVAGAVRTPTLALFGPTSAPRLAPCHNQGVALEPTCPFHPCYERRQGRCDCILKIQARDVSTAALALLRRSL